MINAAQHTFKIKCKQHTQKKTPKAIECQKTGGTTFGFAKRFFEESEMC